MARDDTVFASDLMSDFLERTGVVGDGSNRRYLWTDAFAVMNLLALPPEEAPFDPEHAVEALIDEVHRTLGRHRPDDERDGWISGLGDSEGAEHPTAGGLRIGKERPERPRGEPIDRREEWDRDGQYFHYNTKWAMALERMARATGEQTYRRWATELMEASHDGFVYRSQPGGHLRMYWKMRIDLSEPLVESMGQLDPVDGFVTSRELEVSRDGQATQSVALDEPLSSFESMLQPRDWRTSDALGLGGVLMQAYRVHRLQQRTEVSAVRVEELLEAAAIGMEQYEQGNRLAAPSSQRLAFREFGLALGLELVRRLESADEVLTDAAREARDELLDYLEYRERILEFWLDEDHREAETWHEQRDINEVMFASALLGESVLTPRDRALETEEPT